MLVQLVSNMAPGREIDAADVVIATNGNTVGTGSLSIPSTASLGRPVRIASFVGLAGGRYDIAVTLRRGSTTVQSRHVTRDVDGATVVTVLMTRECNGVMCPGAGDPSAEACLGGRCVQPGCDEEHPELCPMPQCHTDADCAAMMTTVACAPERCSASGTCFSRPDDGLCASGQLCDSLIGCVSVGSDAGPLPSDVGTSDMGQHDSGPPPMDAGHDGGVDANVDASGCAVGAHFHGGSCHAFLDVNGDGIGDLVVGASAESSTNGAAYLYRGSSMGPVLVGKFTTTNAGEHVGMAVADVHDTNGDGFDDVLVSGHAFGPGHAYLILGQASLPATLASAVTLGAPGSTEFGQFMAGVGDVDGDGLADAVVSEDGRSLSHLYLGHMGTGLASLPIADTMPPDLFGSFAPGDLDGDGAGDLALPGALLSNEHVHLYLARAGRFPAATPTATLMCPDGANLGYGALARADVNGDGRIDLIVGASADGTGTVFVYLARAGMTPALGPTTRMTGSTALGAALTGLGDIDGDHFEDVAVASDVTGSARVTIFRGTATGALVAGSSYVLPVVAGRTRVMLDATDLSADGVVDLIVGDPIAGHVYVVRGPLTAATLTTSYDLAPMGAGSFGGAIAAH